MGDRMPASTPERRRLRPRLVVLFVPFGLPLLCRGIAFTVTVPAALRQNRDSSKTAEEAIRRAVCAPDAAPVELNERTVHRRPDWVAMSYVARCPTTGGDSTPPFAGFVTAMRLPRLTVGPRERPFLQIAYRDAGATSPERGDAREGWPGELGPSGRNAQVDYNTGASEG